MSKRMLRDAEAAAYVGLAPATLRKFRVTGGGPAFIKLGRAVVYDPSDLDAWLDRHRRASTTAQAA